MYNENTQFLHSKRGDLCLISNIGNYLIIKYAYSIKVKLHVGTDIVLYQGKCIFIFNARPSFARQNTPEINHSLRADSLRNRHGL